MNQPVLDIRYLRSITDGDHEMEKEFFSLFHQTAERCSERLTKSLDKNDDREWDEAAHELKGAASYLGARRIQHLCQQAREVEGEQRALILAKLMEELEALDAFISDIGHAA